MGIEMHTGHFVIGKSKMKEFKNLIKFMQYILTNVGLKLVAYNPNNCYGTFQDVHKIYHSYHDALFMK